MPVITCHFSNGASFEVNAQTGRSFLEVALEQGVPIRNQCRSGTCLSCSCLGAIDSRPLTVQTGRATSLMPMERDEGKMLCCVSEATTDGALHFDYSSDEAGPSEVQAFVDSVEWIASDAVKLTLELAETHWLDFRAGQYVEITVPGSSESRSYSMCTAPAELPKLAFMIRMLDAGLMSEYLRDSAKPDDVLRLRGPYGDFSWTGSLSRPQLFIAGGTGLSPICSILQEVRASSGSKPPLTLNLGCASPEALLDPTFLRRLEAWMPTLRVNLCVESGAQDDHCVGNALEPIDFDSLATDTEAYVCGPEGLIDAAIERLLSAGVASGNIHYERFVASGLPEVGRTGAKL